MQQGKYGEEVLLEIYQYFTGVNGVQYKPWMHTLQLCAQSCLVPPQGLKSTYLFSFFLKTINLANLQGYQV